MRFVVRVDDVGQAYVQSDRDYELAAFAKWYECWKGLPVYCGVVVGTIGKSEEAWLRENVPEEFIAIHGLTHAKEFLQRREIEACLALFPNANVVIPPYNLYNLETIKAMSSLIKHKPTLLGGFNLADHSYGEKPVIFVNEVLHLSAEKELYAKSWEIAHKMRFSNLVQALSDAYYEPTYPLQIVLHHRWDAPKLDGVKRLRDLIADDMVKVEEAWRRVDEYKN